MYRQHWTTGVAAAAVLLSSGFTATAQQATTPGATSSTTMESLTDGDRRFILDATRSAERDVMLGGEGTSIAVKALGARMVVDHGRAARELKQLALTKGLRVGDTKRPDEPSYDRLTKLSSPSFDQVYLKRWPRTTSRTSPSPGARASRGRIPT